MIDKDDRLSFEIFVLGVVGKGRSWWCKEVNDLNTIRVVRHIVN